MNMIEKVARSIFASQEWTEFSPAFEHQADEVWFPAAKAAIEAMRDPTDDVVDRGCAAQVDLYPAWPGEKDEPTAGAVAATSYNAMIDAALDGK